MKRYRFARCLRSFVPVAGIFTMIAALQADCETASLRWRQLPPIPDRVGFAAPFAGVSGGALIVAGGANFPGAMPWEGGKKVWHDAVFVLPKPDGKWVTGFKLPRAIGYGVSVTTSNGVLCAGGGDAAEHFCDVFLLQWTNGAIQTKPLPPLPGPMANGCGARIGETVYLAGGIDRPDATNALNTFWSLNLAEANPHWRELEPCPGAPRMLAVAGVHGGDFFLFSGVSLGCDAAGKPVRHYLKDAYRHTPGKGWRQIADLPRAAVAAPSPAMTRGDQLLIVSGDDGELVNFEPKSAHPGFVRDVIAYDAFHDQWTRLGDSPLSRATVPAVDWRHKTVIPNGEEKPGRRTPEVWEVEVR